MKTIRTQILKLGLFRLYGPKQAFFDQTWKLNDIEKVK